jgi:hypothetical protein
VGKAKLNAVMVHKIAWTFRRWCALRDSSFGLSCSGWRANRGGGRAPSSWRTINAEARQWFIATVEKKNSWAARPATSDLSTSTVRCHMGQRVLLPLPSRRVARAAPHDGINRQVRSFFHERANEPRSCYVDHHLGYVKTVFKVFAEPTIAVEPREATLHDPGQPGDPESSVLAPIFSRSCLGAPSEGPGLLPQKPIRTQLGPSCERRA